MEENKLLAFEESKRTAYLVTLATLATADGEVDDEEAELIEQMCKEAQLTMKSKLQVLNALYDADSVNLEAQLALLKDGALKFYIVTDILTLVKADGEFTPDEVAEVGMLKAKMNMSDQQYEALNKYVDLAQSFSTEGVTNDFLDKVGLKDDFARLGIPADAFAQGTTVGEALGKSALGVASKHLEGTKLGTALEIGKAVGGVFGGILKSGKKKNKKKKKGFFKKLMNKKLSADSQV